MEIYSSVKTRQLYPGTPVRFCFECASKARPVAVEDFAYFRALHYQISNHVPLARFSRLASDPKPCGTCGELCLGRDLAGVVFDKKVNSGSEIQVEIAMCRSCLGKLDTPYCYVAIDKSRPGHFVRMDPD